MAHKRWRIKDANKDIASEISEKFNIDPLVAFLIASRGIKDDLAVSSFLSDSFEVVDPLCFKDMDVAAFTIGDAIDNNEKICIYGDYDCDGVTSTSLLYLFFKSQGADVCYYIPSRHDEGYGLNINAIDKLKSLGVDLIVTVDNGIAAIDEAEHIYELGMRLVVTDHHQIGDKLPRAEAVVNPHRTDNELSFHDYCGVGVAFKLAQAMYDGEIEDLVSEYIDLVCIGTIADVMPLLNENRAFVKRGLDKINNNPRFAISAFKELNGNEDKNYTANDVAFQLCPRINAVGRIDSANKAVEFLISDNYETAKLKAEQLNIENKHRQEIEKNILDDALLQIENNPSLIDGRVVVIAGHNYHNGVVGIVASHILERYGKPAIIMDIGDDGICRGSARSIEGFNIYDAISYCRDDLIQYGGHPMAAGVTISEDKIDLFRKHINDYAYTNYESLPEQVVDIDCKISPFYLDCDLVDNLEILEPCGADNPQAVFGLYGLVINSITPLSEGKHIRLEVEKKGKKLRIVKFNEPIDNFPYRVGQKLNFAVKISKNLYKGKYYLSVQALDMRLSSTDDDRYFSEKSIYELYKNKNIIKGSLYPSREQCGYVYMFLKANGGYKYGFDNLYFENQDKLTYGELKFALAAFEESGLISITDEIILNNVKSKVKLDDTNVLLELKEAMVNERGV